MNQSQLLDEGAAAELIGMSVSFLRSGRSKGVLGNRTPPPPHFKLGRTIKYARKDLDQWLAERRVDPSARHRASRQAA